MMDINAAAPVITRGEFLVNAPIDVVWDIQVDVAGWPSWRSDVPGTQITGPLGVGTVFRCQTAGLDITSTVHEFEAPHRIVWSGPAQGIVAVHVWIFDEQNGGVIVRTRESWEGAPVGPSAAALQPALDASIRKWLEDLKDAAEARALTA
jgi:uncharacterized protein YndB with AHSA1/START domain